VRCGVAYASAVSREEVTTVDTTAGDDRKEAVAGVWYGVAAYSWWGFVAIYFKAVAHVSAFEVLAHRVVWSVLLLGVLLRVRRRIGHVLEAFRRRDTFLVLLGTTGLIAINWFTFIWAVANDQVKEASLGYFMNPLVNVLLGFVVLHERLRSWQWVAVAFAGVGVAFRIVLVGTVPVVALVLAGSFGLYGLLRKTVRVDALVGLAVEVTLLWPFAVGYLVVLGWTGHLAFGHDTWQTSLLLSLGGVVTCVPLLWFTNAARRLRLSTLGFLQYIAPTMQLMLAVFVFGETFAPSHAVGYGLIWAGLAIYSIDSVIASRRRGT